MTILLKDLLTLDDPLLLYLALLHILLLLVSGGNTMVMHLWGVKATSHMHSLHFGFGFGALLAPQIAKPFLGEDRENNTGNDNV